MIKPTVLKAILKWSLTAFLSLAILLLALVAPIDDTPLASQPFYTHTMDKVDTFQLAKYPGTKTIEVGWSQFSIVPDQPVPMAGYKPRDKYTDIHDTVYIRIMAINNGSITTFLITSDLLLFPPTLKEAILGKHHDTNDFIYFSATHTHTSVGGWEPSLLGKILMGDFNEVWMEELATKTVQHMAQAKSKMLPAELSYWEVEASKYVINRIDSKEEVDGKLRGIRVVREDSTKAMLFTFGAHPTLIWKKFTSLSGDYPNEIIKELSKDYDHSQFMAGAVGSQRFTGIDKIFDFELTHKIGELFTSFINNAAYVPLPDTLTIQTGHLQLEHGPSQLRLMKNIKLRDWVFRAVNEPLQGEVTVLKIGNVLLLGTPCDFSGEIVKSRHWDQLAEDSNIRLIITSFNGEYTGYITEDEHYSDKDDEEVRILNWVGPYFGAYYTEIVEKVIDKATEEEVQ